MRSSSLVRGLAVVVAGVGAFGVVYVAAVWWLPGALSWASGVVSWRVSVDLLDQLRQLGAAGVGLAVGGAAARLVWKGSWWQGSAVGGVDLAAEVGQLGDVVLARVLASVVRVRAVVPMPLRVGFRSAVGVGAERGPVMREPGARWAELPLEGDLGQVADRLRGLPLRQLVVIGVPGAGKSVLALMLTQLLLETRSVGEPVPVFLPVSSWNPLAESVQQLVVRRLREDFGVSPQAADLLVGSARSGGVCPWWVMPVLDGLDEVRVGWHEAALRRVEQYAALNRPVVVTCRVREWQQAEARAGVLSRAAVVRLEPLQPEDVISFLSEPAGRRSLWGRVFERLREPSSVLAGVLSTPLMAGLARDVFAGRGDPDVLADMRTRREVTGSLIDGYVDVVYHAGSWSQAGSGGRGVGDFRAGDARRWLSNLAYLADQDGGQHSRPWPTPRPAAAVRGPGC